ncbi:CNNM, transmembrane domain [Dillenia turbinata]|uniref:CNNM, transmembrane domain n=1 Tax=Dillenia turbinata TaxID=194707 RepID=A0AAN8ZGE4_9MAGN
MHEPLITRAFSNFNCSQERWDSCLGCMACKCDLIIHKFMLGLYCNWLEELLYGLGGTRDSLPGQFLKVPARACAIITPLPILPIFAHRSSNNKMRDDDVPCCEPEFWLFMIICFVLVAAAGLASGLALGLLSFSQIDLEVLIKAGQPHERKNAAKIVHIVKNQHLLLCTLLIGKSLAMEALPIFLDSILPTWAAILISVTLEMTFAEVLPQAVCARYGLSFGAKLSTLVRLLLLVLFPIAYPISRLLDWLLGKEHSALLRRAELKTLVDLHGDGAGKGGELTHHETTIIAGALDLTQKTAKDAMTAICETFTLDINSKLDKHTMSLVMSKGHSRIPVYSGSPKTIIGLILTVGSLNPVGS